MVFDGQRIGERGRQRVGAVRLGHREHLREIALWRFQPGRLMVIEGLMHLDDNRALRRRPSMNVYREVVEFRARPGIVESLRRLSDLMLDDEIRTRPLPKSARNPPPPPRPARPPHSPEL